MLFKLKLFPNLTLIQLREIWQLFTSHDTIGCTWSVFKCLDFRFADALFASENDSLAFNLTCGKIDWFKKGSPEPSKKVYTLKNTLSIKLKENFAQPKR